MLSNPSCPIRCSCLGSFVFSCPVLVVKCNQVGMSLHWLFPESLSFMSCISFASRHSPLIPRLCSPVLASLLFPISNQLLVFKCPLCSLLVCVLFIPFVSLVSVFVFGLLLFGLFTWGCFFMASQQLCNKVCLLLLMLCPGPCTTKPVQHLD